MKEPLFFFLNSINYNPHPETVSLLSTHLAQSAVKAFLSKATCQIEEFSGRLQMTYFYIHDRRHCKQRNTSSYTVKLFLPKEEKFSPFLGRADFTVLFHHAIIRTPNFTLLWPIVQQNAIVFSELPESLFSVPCFCGANGNSAGIK